MFGLNCEAIADAKKAVGVNCDSVSAREALGKALYAAGWFEKALVEFHRIFRQVVDNIISILITRFRLRQTKYFDDWITRCEETILSFLSTANLDSSSVRKVIGTTQTMHWREVFKTENEDENCSSNKALENRAEECHEKLGKKKSKGSVLGKLNEDMLFLEKLANHPSIQHNFIKTKIDRKEKNNIEDLADFIKDTATDGLKFLQVREGFWEASLPPKPNVKKGKANMMRRSMK